MTNKHTACVIVALCFGTVLHGGEIQEQDQKIISQATILSSSERVKRAANIFWKNAHHHTYENLNCSTLACETMQWILEDFPEVRCMQSNTDYQFTKSKIPLPSPFPLDFITIRALNRPTSSPECELLKKIARIDTHNPHRISALRWGIQFYSVDTVKELLDVRTDITGAQHIMQQVVQQCTSQEQTSLSHRTRLLKIASLLLRAGANLTQAAEEIIKNQEHIKNESCITCPLIMHHITKQKLIRQTSNVQKEHDQKKLHQTNQDVQGIEWFWKQIDAYHQSCDNNKSFLERLSFKNDQTNKKDSRQQYLDSSRKLLIENPRIFSSRSSSSALYKRYKIECDHYKINSFSPLMIAALMSVDQPPTAPERPFFKAIVPFAPHNQRIEALIFGIKHASFPLVRDVLSCETDVTHAPEVMRTLVDQCRSVRERYQYEDDCCLERYRLLGITSLLLGERAALTGMPDLAERMHVKLGCFNCNLILDSINSERLNSDSSSSSSQLNSSSSSSSSSTSSSLSSLNS
jgi:hypothetical protein